MDYFPEVVQVVPHEDYTVTVYFHDGKIVLYDARELLGLPVFRKISDIKVFMETCTILNDTLAWDIAYNRDESKCLDIDPDTLYQLPASDEKAF